MTLSLIKDGIPNLAYWSSGTRTYGPRPILANRRLFWELQWVFSGTAHPNPPRKEDSQLPTPRLHIAHPESLHGWTDQGDAPSEVFVLHFRQVPAELHARLKSTESLTFSLKPTEARFFATRTAELATLLRQNDRRVALKLEQILIEVALFTLEQDPPSPSRVTPIDRVQLALNWYRQHLAEHPSAADTAAALGLSPAHLRRFFQAAGLRPPRKEFELIRLETAKQLLASGWKSERIADYLGFSEPSAFSRAFKRSLGLSPKKWRKPH